ncbi:MAG TPA: hypothetical protein VFA68_00210 [Terriglobales bacterium]|nr:hypothetical protein [Terriglobales bacterium]
MTPESLVRTVEEFLAGSREAVVVEDGAVTFDLGEARYSISGEYNKCLLHFWSSERNIVRRVVDAEAKNDVLRLEVRRLGQSRPSKLEICRRKDRRTPSAKRAARVAYRRVLERMLARHFAEFQAVQLSTAMDLERSFGPVYTRGVLRRGQSAFAILGVNGQETQASIDAALTFGILWLEHCRDAWSGKAVVHGLKMFLPAGKWDLVRERMAHLHHGAAQWELYAIDESADTMTQLDIADLGNIATRLVHACDERSAQERFADPITLVRQLMPEVEIAVLSGAEIAFRRRGMEFARARLSQASGSSFSGNEIVFGIGAEEKVLCDQNAEHFVRLVKSVGEVRHPEGPRDHPLWRLYPERWLESLVLQNVNAVDERLDHTCVYSQVPAFSAADRGMLDVLCATHEGRLAVLELKADEDIHLPLQGLDYWSRVAWHHERGEFQKFGYFPRRELALEPPLLFLVAPAFHVHPATDTLLRFLSPEIDWTLLAIDERWREGVRVVFRKRRDHVNCQLPVAN